MYAFVLPQYAMPPGQPLRSDPMEVGILIAALALAMVLGRTLGGI